MKVYLVKYGAFSYDEYEGFVIVAENKSEALTIANEKAEKTNRYLFTSKHVLEVNTKIKGIVLESFNAGCRG